MSGISSWCCMHKANAWVCEPVRAHEFVCGQVIANKLQARKFVLTQIRLQRVGNNSLRMLWKCIWRTHTYASMCVFKHGGGYAVKEVWNVKKKKNRKQKLIVQLWFSVRKLQSAVHFYLRWNVLEATWDAFLSDMVCKSKIFAKTDHIFVSYIER